MAQSRWPDPSAVTTRQDFAEALTALRERAGLSVRDLAKRVNAPHGTLGDYFSGRHLPPSTQTGLIREVVLACGVDAAGVEQWLDALRRARHDRSRRDGRRNRTARAANPYPGLRSFEESDAAHFFGRESDVHSVLRRIGELHGRPGPRTLLVVGPSGTGKSSLIRAGVVAQCVTAGFGTAVITPSGAPDAVLEPQHVPDPAYLLVVDQFEEIFAAPVGPDERAAFLAAVLDRKRAVTVLVLRADFYAAATAEPLLRAVMSTAHVVVGPMTEDELRTAVREPARQAGSDVDDALVELLVRDLTPRAAVGQAYDPGALPLLAHALRATWDNADGGALSISAYRAAGGIGGAIRQSAEETYGALDQDGQVVARRLFLRLIAISNDAVATRRHAGLDELASTVDREPARLAGVIEAFVGRRLLTVDADTVRLTHEALIAAWPRLAGWIDEDRAALRTRYVLTTSANEWDSGGRQAADLVHGNWLNVVAEWATQPSHRAELNERERNYLDASVAARAAARNAERIRAQRLRRALAVAAVLAIGCAVLAAVAFQSRSEAVRARRLATVERDQALSRDVAIQSQQLTSTDPALAQQLALAAYRISPTTDAQATVIQASGTAPITRILGSQGPTALTVHGSVIAAGNAADGGVRLLQLATSGVPHSLGTIPGDRRADRQFALAFSPDGRWLAIGGEEPSVQIWQVSDPHRPALAASLAVGFTNATHALAFTSDGQRLLIGGTGRRPLEMWDVRTPSHPAQLAPPAGIPTSDTVQTLGLSSDGTLLAAGCSDGDAYVWSVDDMDQRPATMNDGPGTLFTLTFVPHSHDVVTGDSQGRMIEWALGPRPTRVRTLHTASGAGVNTVAFSPDASMFVSGSTDDTVAEWSTSTWAVVQSTPNPGPVTGVALSADGRTVISTAADGALRLWPAAKPSIPVSGSVFSLVYDESGDRLAVGWTGPQGGAQVWDVTRAGDPRPLGPALHMPSGTPAIDGTVSLRPDGNLLAAGNAAGRLELWDVHDPQRARVTTPPFGGSSALIESTAFSADGTLLAAGSDDNKARIWDVRDPSRPRLLSAVSAGNLMLAVAFNRAGTLLAGASADDHVYLWSIADPAHPHLLARLSGFGSYAYGVTFSPDGRLLAATSADHTTRIWNVRDPARPTLHGPVLTGPTNYVNSPSFAPNGRSLIVASNDHTAWLYNVSDPSRGAAIRGATSDVLVSTFSPTGRQIAIGGRDSVVRLLDPTPAVYAARLCPVVGDPITRSEWQRYVPGAPYDPPCRRS